MHDPRRFCLAWLATLAAILVAVAAINAVIDPYRAFGTPPIAGLNAIKPRAGVHGPMSKTYQIERMRPVTVLLGSSRVDLGIDPDSAAWPADMRPVYNYGIDSGSIVDARGNLREAAATGRLRHAVVVLDFEDFWRPRPRRDRPSEAERRYLVLSDGSANPARPKQRVQDLFFSVLTLQAFKDSLLTVLDQHRSPPFDVRPDGLSTEADLIGAATADGYHELFREKAQQILPQLRAAGRRLAGRPGTLPNLAVVADMIAFCHQHRISLTLIISPTQAALLTLYERYGLWPWFEAWKEQLAALLPAHAGGAAPVTLWDFSGYTRYSSEPVPRQGDRRTALHWFWEPHHFKQALGDLMIGRIYEGTSPDLGSELTEASLPADIQRLRAGRAAYHCFAPAQPASIRSCEAKVTDQALIAN